MTGPSDGPRKGGSRLRTSSSAYLRSAADQAIEWYPWGTEPFELARRTGRPLLLDIGASWCHWCHVMDEGTYSDPEVARLLKEHFVAVKVDRDELPEVDRRYQRQVGALTGEGGWPLTGFLNPDGEAFLGGTYFPPTRGHGRPGFRDLLREVARLWKEEPERLREHAKAAQEALVRLGAPRRPERADLAEFVDSVRSELRSGFDPVHGGWGGAPKFPHPSAVAFLLWDAFRHRREQSAGQARETLERMADGGMYDQVGGGFHRYAVDEGWHVPHFEKMAVDNAELLEAYADGLRSFAEPRFEEAIRGTVRWCRETLADPRGGWGASQDADNAPGDDGGYFTWTRAELKEALDPLRYRLVVRALGVDTEGRMPHDPERNVLFRPLPLADAAAGLELPDGPDASFASALDTLRGVREHRPRPAVDPALYANVNGRLIGSFAKASGVLGDPTALADAKRAADRWLAHAFSPSEGVAHRLEGTNASGHGLLDDQVAFARGLLELSWVAVEPRYLDAATALLRLVDSEFRGEAGVLRDVSPRLYDGPKIGGVDRTSYSLEDSPHLAANAAAAQAFVRLGAVLHDETWVDKARSLLPPVAARVHGAGLFAAGSALAAGLLDAPAVLVVVEGAGPPAEELVRAAWRTFHPNALVFAQPPPPPFSHPATVFADRPKGAARALVCVGNSCGPPLTEPAELSRAVREARGSNA